mgnify:CR=1 FL=1
MRSELDPNFALAAARLASIYTNLHELAQAQRYMDRAFARSDSLSEPERLFVSANYHYIVTGRLDEVVAAYRLWIETYPQEWVPHINLSTTYDRLGRLNDALEEARAAVRLGSNSVVTYQPLGRALIKLGRFDEAKAALEEAAGRGLDSSFNRALLYGIAFVKHDADGMQRHFDAAAGRPDGYLVVAEAARAALASGQIERGRSLYAQAIADARTARVDDYAGGLLAEQALGDALLGDTRARATACSGRSASAAASRRRGRRRSRRRSRGMPNRPRSWPIAIARLHRRRPTSCRRTVRCCRRACRWDARTAGRPSMRSTTARRTAWSSARGCRACAASPTRRSTITRAPPRSFARSSGGAGTSATHPLHTLAALQLARALRAAGQTADARQAYGDFMASWQNGDRRHPFFVAAAREAAALQP